MIEASAGPASSTSADIAGSQQAADAIASSLERASESFAHTLADGMEAAVSRGRTLEDVLKSAALALSGQALRASVAPLADLVANGASGLAGSLASLLGGANGGSGASVTAFAAGGVLGGPTVFPTGGSSLAFAGEAGPEAILPLARGPDGALGVRSAAGASTAPPIVVNIQAADIESFRRSEAQVTTMLARAVTRGRRGL